MPDPDKISTIQKAMEQSKTKDEFKKILCVWLKEALSLTSTQIAIALGQTPTAVRKTQSRFMKEGIETLLSKQKGGRKRENISFNREKQILAKFQRLAQRGSALNIRHIQMAYELSVGKAVARSTIYRLIARHGLRRYLPRARTLNQIGKRA
jgi:hypothetical protein